MNFGGCTLCDLQSSVLLPSKDGILLNLIGFWLYSVNLLDVVAGSPAFTICYKTDRSRSGPTFEYCRKGITFQYLNLLDVVAGSPAFT